MEKLRNKIKKSSFIVNKLYLFLLFIFFLISDATLGFVYFILSIFIYIWKTLTSKVPMSVSEDIKVKPISIKRQKKDLKIDIYYPNTPLLKMDIL